MRNCARSVTCARCYRRRGSSGGARAPQNSVQSAAARDAPPEGCGGGVDECLDWWLGFPRQKPVGNFLLVSYRPLASNSRRQGSSVFTAVLRAFRECCATPTLRCTTVAARARLPYIA